MFAAFFRPSRRDIKRACRILKELSPDAPKTRQRAINELEELLAHGALGRQLFKQVSKLVRHGSEERAMRLVRASAPVSRATRLMAPFAYWQAWGIATVVGAVVAGATHHQFREALDSRYWESTPGRIVESRVVRKRTTTTDGQGRSRSSTKLVARIRYRYEVDGQRLIGRRRSLRLVRGFTSPRTLVERYPVGLEVIVYFNPNAPKKATLIAGPSPHDRLALTVMYSLLGLLALVFVSSLGVRLCTKVRPH